MGIKITSGIKKIEKDINRALARDLDVRIGKNRNKVLRAIKTASIVWLESQPEIISLRQTSVPGSLSSIFGINEGEADSIVNQIVQAISESINLNVGKSNQFSKTLIELNFQPKDFNNLLSISGAKTLIEGGSIPWLEWLLTKGDAIIISGYYYKPLFNKGRSGGGLMIPGGVFRVPPEFSGTVENNFITRTFEGKQEEIGVILRGLLD
jgi:hypothetical protein